MYLHFPDLDPSATGKPEKLQIGYCYMPGLASTRPGAQNQAQQQQTQGGPLSGRGNTVTAADREAEIVRPLRVRNVSDRKLYLTCTPNLRKQCFVYAESPSSDSSDNRVSSTSSPSAAAAAAAAANVVGGEEGGVAGVTGGGGGGSDWSAGVPNRPQVADLPLLPQSETTLYIGLRPVLPLEAYTSG